MNNFKKIFLILSLMAAVPAQSHPLDQLDPQETAKLMLWLANALPLAYYFFHYPEARNSNAPFERILRGFFDNLFHDIVNWENITNFTDILPGQRWKIYSFTIEDRQMFKLKLVVDPKKRSIKGFGLYHFLEKNMSKIVRYCAALGISYAVATGKLEASLRTLKDAILHTYNIPVLALTK